MGPRKTQRARCRPGRGIVDIPAPVYLYPPVRSLPSLHVSGIPALDPVHRSAALARQECLTKPAGSLGALEALAVELASVSRDGVPRSRPASAILFASDHPVATRGVSAYPQQVTAAMVSNFVRGGAAAAVLARHTGVDLLVVDVGVAHPYAVPARGDGQPGPSVRLVRDPVADAEVGDISFEDGMTTDTLSAALEAGRRAVAALDPTTRVVILGEMGIGNTTVAAAVAGVLLGHDAEAIVGAGTGVSGAALEAKKEIVRLAMARVAPGSDPARVLCAVGGRDMAALVGAAGEAAARGMTVLVDGFIVSVAMLALVRACADVRRHLVFSHRSREHGHHAVLEALGATPLLDLRLRLGEASGALAALPLLDLSCALHLEMATFAEAGVPDRDSP